MDIINKSVWLLNESAGCTWSIAKNFQSLHAFIKNNQWFFLKKLPFEVALVFSDTS